MITFSKYVENNDMTPVKEDPTALLYSLILRAWKSHKSETLNFISTLSKKDETIKSEMSGLLDSCRHLASAEEKEVDKDEVSPSKADGAAGSGDDSGF